jgi:Ser/Thr protein kinase RdoA (MazF antagonist)
MMPATQGPFPAQSSVLDERALLDQVVNEYALPSAPLTCRFLTRGDSDVYRVTCENGARFYLKIRRPPVTREFCEAEAMLVEALSRAALPVVRPAPLKDGRYSIWLNASEGERPTLMFEEAPSPLRDMLDFRQLGALLARVHEASDAIENDLPDIDVASFATKAQNIIDSAVLPSGEAEIALRAVENLVARLESFPRSKPDYGICHGDLACCNLRIDAGGQLWLFDFGHARRSWRGLELANVWRKTLGDNSADQRAANWQEFLAGYASVRALPVNLDEFISLEEMAGKLYIMSYICGPLTLRRGVEPMESNDFQSDVERLRRLLD